MKVRGMMGGQVGLLDEMCDRAGAPRFNHTIFMRAGPCSQYPHVVHQYAGCWPCARPGTRASMNVSISTHGSSDRVHFTPLDATANTFPTFYDLYNESCLNGWTMGNLAVGTQDSARFYHLLAGGNLVSTKALPSMQHWRCSQSQMIRSLPIFRHGPRNLDLECLSTFRCWCKTRLESSVCTPFRLSLLSRRYFSAGWNARSLGMEYGMGLMKLRDLDVYDVHGNHANYTDHWGQPPFPKHISPACALFIRLWNQTHHLSAKINTSVVMS